MRKVLIEDFMRLMAFIGFIVTLKFWFIVIPCLFMAYKVRKNWLKK